MLEPGPDQFLLFHYIDSGGILLILGGMIHVLIKVGAMKTKIDTLWNWFTKRIDAQGSGD